MNIFIPVLYICINGHCEFFQQQGHYTNSQQCMAVVAEKKEEYVKMGAVVEATCIQAMVQKRGLYES